MRTSPSRRPYHSPRREAAARETREAVLEAARREFTTNGYRSTTLGAIAQRGGVSLATVKLVEPTKARLLVAAIEAVVRSDDASVGLVEQPWWKALLANADARGLLLEFGARTAAALDRQVELLEVVWQAAAAESEIARLEQQASLGRWADLRTMVEALAARGDLPTDLDRDAVTDVIWAMASPQAFSLLVRGRGWTPGRWGAWLGDALVQILLGDRSPNVGRRSFDPAPLASMQVSRRRSLPAADPPAAGSPRRGRG